MQLAELETPLQLNATRVIETIDQLHRRIKERFPESGLSEIAARLSVISKSAVEETEQIKQVNMPLRIGIAAMLVLMAVVVVLLVKKFRFSETTAWTMLEGIDAGISSMVFLGATALFLISLESRIKRRKTLNAVERLRELAHIVDMHQLTKDPERLCRTHRPTESSPIQSMTPYELGRYLDYCAEMLSLIGKVVMIYGQDASDSVVLSSVDAIESLTTSLSRKIWQKIMLLDQIVPRERRVLGESPLAEAPESADATADESTE